VCIKDELFDTNFFMHQEDIDLCWRAQLFGWESVYVPDAIAFHIRGFRPGKHNRQTVSSEMRFYAVRNRYLLIMKNEYIPHFWRDIAHILFYELLIFLYLLLRERDSLRAYGSAWNLRHRMWAKRRLIQVRRTEMNDLRYWFRG
jgi:GT2 family glycosyltransferase